uniref:clp protease proteolytic subunit n=1 Tax=Ludwigia hyssopifolia TaxID=155013 RepID=UPI0026E17000|nr:clp protease proteolytic subunit [Ludwigia hyssopifolia]WJO89889.1 clp protease proteolytic subunit [Ludwigia hyssopifolia]
MPVGVPKIAFLIPGDEEASWVDVNRLYRERFLFLGDEVNAETSNQLSGLMLFLAIEEPSRDQFLYINSPGGLVISGVAIYQTMKLIPPDVHTIGMGIVASMASFILTGGTIPTRLAFPHARVMIHQPASTYFKLPVGEFVLESEELLKIRESVVQCYVQNTGQPFWIVSEDLERDTFMSATEALSHGIVDLIAC